MASLNENQLLADVFDRIPSAVIVLDPRGRIKKANKSAMLLLGAEKLEGRVWREVVKESLRTAKNGSEIVSRDGRRLQIATLPMSQGMGQLIQMTDQTETRNMQDKLSHMERLSSLGKMAAALAHQIRTPLSAAILYANNLTSSRLTPEARVSFQKKLISRLETLNGQIDNILMFARTNQQKASLLDAAGIVEQSVCNVAANISKAGADIKTSIEDCPMPIMANQTALAGAISNLVVNAVEAGAKNILVALHKKDKEIYFDVANDGPEIDESIKARIFEPFFTSKSNGTGLGLAVVNAVAKVHQGRVELTSDENYPTVFRIYMPLFDKEGASETKDQHLDTA